MMNSGIVGVWQLVFWG